MTPTYVGRFAPSPTGHLHAGSVLAAVASWVDARAHGGRWLLRIDDLDEGRCRPEYVRALMTGLQRLGLEWDGPVDYQSRRKVRYRDALETLIESGLAYGCACTRRQLSALPRTADHEVIYPGTCRELRLDPHTAHSVRARLDGAHFEFADRICGPQAYAAQRDCGDCIIRRGDGLIAYQLAVVVDDADAGVSDVVRGQDLLHSTGRQIVLQRMLGLPMPKYAHIPLLQDAHARKLSKSEGAAAVDTRPAAAVLTEALQRLGQTTVDGSLKDILDYAVAHWNIGAIPRHSLTVDPTAPATGK